MIKFKFFVADIYCYAVGIILYKIVECMPPMA